MFIGPGRYFRFQSAQSRRSPSVLEQLTHVDGVNHVAVVAIEAQSDGSRHGAGVARFVRSESQPGQAELAVTVADRDQGRGIARQLMIGLAKRARERGIDTFVMLVLASVIRVRRMLAELGARGETSTGGVIDYHIPVARVAAPAEHA